MASPSSPIRVGLVGFGHGSSVFHAPLLQSVGGRFIITHVLERSTNKSEAAVEPKPQIVRSMDDLLAADVQLIVISTPTHVHFEQAKQAIIAKRHVVVDKPLCITAQQAQELLELASAHGVLFTVFQNRRWDGDFLTIKKLIANRSLGDVKKYEAHYDRYRPTLKGSWKEQPGLGGGVLYDLGAHLVDQAIQLFGTPDSVTADVQVQRDGANDDDYFRLELHYVQRPDLLVILTAGMLVKEAGPKYVVEGSQGSYVKYNEDVQEDSLRAGMRPGDVNWGCEPESAYGTLTKVNGESEVIQTLPGSYEVYYSNVADAILNGEELVVDPKDIVEQIRILEDAKKTMRVCRQSTE